MIIFGSCDLDFCDSISEWKNLNLHIRKQLSILVLALVGFCHISDKVEILQYFICTDMKSFCHYDGTNV